MLRHHTYEEDPRLAIIVPIFNEREGLETLMDHLETWRQRGAEIIVVDGGSDDKSDSLVEARGFPLLQSARGRATQMNAGARSSQSPFLLFLHADTRLPEYADTQATAHLARSEATWGRFDVRIDGRSRLLPIIGAMMNLRSRLTGIATGDQALFMTRTLFEQVGGFPEQPLMEDVEICKRLIRISPPVCLKDRVVTSGRRWDQCGGWRTIVLMWQLRWAYWRGVPADQLAARYR